jgi:hypothetical protein
MSKRPISDLRHLRPLTLPEMLDRAYALLARNASFFIVCSVVYAANELGLAIFRKLGGSSESVQRWGSALYVGLSFVGELGYAVAIAGAFQATLFPKRVLSFKALVRAIAPRLPAFLLTRLLLSLCFILFAMVIPMQVLGAKTASGSRIIPGMVAAFSIVIAVRILFVWALVPLTLVVERRSFVRAALRSGELMQTNFGGEERMDSAYTRLLCGILLPLLVGITIVAVMQGWNVMVHRPMLNLLDLPFDNEERTAAPVARGLIALFCTPLVWVLITTLYAECRMRRDGLDFQVRLIESGAGNPDSELTALAPES